MSIETGRPMMQKRFHSKGTTLRALGRLRKEIVDTVGAERARTVLTRFGYSIGYQDAVRLRESVAWDNLEEWMRMGPALLREWGLLDPDIESLTMTPRGSFHCELHWEQGAEVVMHLESYPPDADPVCWVTCGYLSGYASAVTGSEVCFLEQGCRGAESTGGCRAIGKLRNDWDIAARPLLRYFEEEDVGAELVGVYDELRRINEQLTDLTQSATDAIVATNSRGHIKVFNRAAEHIFGYKAYEVLGRSIEILISQDDYEHYRKQMRQFLETGESEVIGRSHEMMAKRSNETYIPLEVSLSVSSFHRDPMFTAIARDITRRKQLEAERMEKSIDLEATLNSTSDGLLMVKSIDDDAWITLVNRRLGELLGIEPSLLMGRRHRDFHNHVIEMAMDPESYRQTVDDLDVCSEREIAGTLDLAQPAAITIEWHTGPVRDNDNNVIGRIWSIRDVTLQREAERRIKGYAQELERTVVERTSELNTVLDELRTADELKSRFISNVSHEFRTPLTSIRGFTETILREPEMPDGTIREFLTIIEDETFRLTHLIEDLLDISRIEAGHLELSLQPVCISDLARKVQSAMQPMLRERNLRLEVESDLDEPQIQGDSDRLYRVIQNIVSNAIKFTPAKGLIKIEVRTDSERDEVDLLISDTGVGIPEKDLPRIFDRFHQVDRPTMKVGGTGLGLSIVKNLVEAHGGKVVVRSRVGEGTTFEITFPLEATVSPAIDS